MSGRFLVLEGIDGCGKTTQIEALRAWLPLSGLMAPGSRLLVTREPGGTALGQALRALLLHPPAGVAPCSLCELMLYAADRAQHVEECLRPALAAGDWVLSDRYSGSTAAYQGHGRGLPMATIHQLEARPPAAWSPISPSGSISPWPDPCSAAATGPPTGSRPRARPSCSGSATASPAWPPSGAGSGSRPEGRSST